MSDDNVIKILGIPDIDKIYEKIMYRQERYHETLIMSIGVVLMNYGDQYVNVSCVGKEWSGTKGDLTRTTRSGIPLCPNGHVLLETSSAPRLALIKEE